MSNIKSEFEKIELVKERLNHIWWSQERGYCDTGKHPIANASFLNGAWYAYQHQQSKVDELQKRVDACNRLINKWSKDADYADQIAQEDFVQNTLWNCIDELEQALKGGKNV